MTDIAAKLDQLAEYQSALDILNMDCSKKRDEIMSKVKDELDALEQEYSPKMMTAGASIVSLTDEIKALVIANRASVKGNRLHAIYSKGRVSWDTKGLDGYSVGHPELEAFRKVGEPSVTIRVR